jgi:hypothetical protein
MEYRLDQFPTRLITPMFAKNIGDIRFQLNVLEVDKTACHKTPNVMKGKYIMPFMELSLEM